jgi:cytochrome c peroxidase
MFDGRESSPLTGTIKILPTNYPQSLRSNLLHQSVDATTGHAQGDGTRPTPAEQQQIVDFEMALFTAQATGRGTGNLDARGATGGPKPLISQPFFIGTNSQIPAFENPASGPFNPAIFNSFDAWAGLPYNDPRAAVARGQVLFNSKPISITGVAGLNDDKAAGGLVTGGIPVIAGFCGTCHDTPNVGNHSFPTPLNIGTGDPSLANQSINLGGLDISYLPKITVRSKVTGEEKTTSDLGQALIDGRFDHVGKIKGPILRGLSARAPYFHNGSAQSLLDVVHFYELRFGVVFTLQEEADLVAFLSSL